MFRFEILAWQLTEIKVKLSTKIKLNRYILNIFNLQFNLLNWLITNILKLYNSV